MRNPCQGCSLDPADGQLYVNPIAKTPGGTGPNAWNQGLGTSCVSPYVQDCNMLPLNDSICALGDASTVVPGMAGETMNYSYGVTGHGGFANYTAEKRVGGCFTSEDMYGPGTFSVLVNLPPTLVAPDEFIAETGYPVPDVTGLHYGTDSGAAAAPGMSGGRGYVFSMWTFSYSEAYLPPVPKLPGGKPIILTGSFDAAAQPQTDDYARSDTSSTQYIDGNGDMKETSSLQGFAIPEVPGVTSGDPDNGYYTIHNAEIDIEIPSNTGQVAGVSADNQKTFLGLNTANFNTWVTDQDNDSYLAGTPTLYQQAQATAPTGQFFASVGPDDDENTYHEFSFVWYVDPKEESLPFPSTTRANSYVAFLRDGQEIFRCHRFVPRRSGRVVIGMWPAWWGSVRNPMAYSQVYAKIARIEFTPQCDYSGTPFVDGALVTNAPQLYDEVLPMADGSYNEIKCGFNTPIHKRGAAAYPPGAKFCFQAKSLGAARMLLQDSAYPDSNSTSLAHSGKTHKHPKKAEAPGVKKHKKKLPKWVLPVVVSVICVLAVMFILAISVAVMKRNSTATSAPAALATPTPKTRSASARLGK